jgi:RHS repeat-associated protein
VHGRVLLQFGYDVGGNGRPYTATESGATVNPMPNGAAFGLYSATLYYGTTTSGTYDSDSFTLDQNTGRITNYSFSVGGGSPMTGALTWNANGTLGQLQITNPWNSSDSQTCTYGHDDLVRITSANCGTPWSQTFTYDVFGNIAKSGSISFAANYDPASNHFTSIGNINVPSSSYDSDGNLLNDTYNGYAWDSDANVVTIDAGTCGADLGNTISITYDALDRAVERSAPLGCPNAGYTQILYGFDEAKLAIMSGQTLNKAFIPLPGGATAVYTTSATQAAYYRHPDWLGSSRLASTPARGIYSTTEYAPFGEPYDESGTTDRSYTGQNNDTAQYSYDFLFREQNWLQGRWIQPDRAGLAAVDMADPQSWNRCAYVRNSPTEVADLFGLDIGAQTCLPNYQLTGNENGDQGDETTNGYSCFTVYLPDIPSFLTGGGEPPPPPKKPPCSAATRIVGVAEAFDGFQMAGAAFTLAGVHLGVAGLLAVGGCSDPTPFELLTCITGLAGAGSATAGAGVLGYFGYREVTAELIPGIKQATCEP